MALNDEGQQYGNLDEASAVARTPRKCLVIWCGDCFLHAELVGITIISDDSLFSLSLADLTQAAPSQKKSFHLV